MPGGRLCLQASSQHEVDYERELEEDVHDDEYEAQDQIRVDERVQFALEKALVHTLVAVVYHHNRFEDHVTPGAQNDQYQAVNGQTDYVQNHSLL